MSWCLIQGGSHLSEAPDPPTQTKNMNDSLLIILNQVSGVLMNLTSVFYPLIDKRSSSCPRLSCAVLGQLDSEEQPRDPEPPKVPAEVTGECAAWVLLGRARPTSLSRKPLVPPAAACGFNRSSPLVNL